MVTEDPHMHERLLEVFAKKVPLPTKLELRPTDKCHLYCRHCWRRMETEGFRYDDELPPSRWVEIIREAADLGIRKIEFVGGGEPMHDPDAAMRCVREVKSACIFGDLVTSGTKFTDDIIREMVELGWDRIMFSLDGANPISNDYVRFSRGAFELATWAIGRFTHWKDALGSERPLLGMVPVLTNRNYTEFKDYIGLAHKLGVYHVGFKPLFAFHESGASLQLTGEHLGAMNAHIEEALPLAQRYGIETNMDSLVHRPGNEVVKNAADVTVLYREDISATRIELAKELGLTEEELHASSLGEIYETFSKFLLVPCFLPWSHLTILANGDVSPCTGAGALKTKPNVRDTSLRDALSDEILARFRETLAKGDFPAVCKSCCVGLFLDNRRYRRDLKGWGANLLQQEKRPPSHRRLRQLLQVFTR